MEGDKPVETEVSVLEKIAEDLSDIAGFLDSMDDGNGKLLSRVAEATEYIGYMLFQKLMLDSLPVVVSRPEEGTDGENLKKLTESMLKRVWPPPFAERIKVASVAANIDVEQMAEETSFSKQSRVDEQLETLKGLVEELAKKRGAAESQRGAKEKEND